jgi:hypothetical protein
MEAAGVIRAEPIAHRLGDGELVRFRCVGDPLDQRNGAAWLWLSGWPDGGWWNFELGISGMWSLPQPKPAPEKGILAKSARRARADTSAQAKE